MNRAINISLPPQVCHAVDRMGDTGVLFKCATVVRLCKCGARTTPGHSQSVRTFAVGWRKKLRHLASVRLTCMILYSLFGSETMTNESVIADNMKKIEINVSTLFCLYLKRKLTLL